MRVGGCEDWEGSLVLLERGEGGRIVLVKSGKGADESVCSPPFLPERTEW